MFFVSHIHFFQLLVANHCFSFLQKPETNELGHFLCFDWNFKNFNFQAEICRAVCECAEVCYGHILLHALYVLIRILIFTCMHLHVLYAPVCIYMHLYASVRICMYLYAFVCICLHLYAPVCICMHLPAFVCICMHLPASALICMHRSSNRMHFSVTCMHSSSNHMHCSVTCMHSSSNRMHIIKLICIVLQTVCILQKLVYCLCARSYLY